MVAICVGEVLGTGPSPGATPCVLNISMLGDLASTNRVFTPTIPLKGWAVLAFLLLEPGRVYQREYLAATLWPNLPEDAARNNLRQVLLTLQRALCDQEFLHPCLIADRTSLRFNPECRHQFDVLEFLSDLPECPAQRSRLHCGNCLQQMEVMASLYRGEFMAGFYLAGCAEFDEWLGTKREMLRLRVLVLLERLSNCYETFGATGKALSFAMRCTELDPWNEEGQRRVMRLMARNGQRTAALGYYEYCCRTLKQELDVLPEEATQKLVRLIRNEEPIPPAGDSRCDGQTVLSQAMERRQVTVLYCRIAADESGDPDDELELLHGPEKWCIDSIQSFFGHVVRTNDGGMLAYFGYPGARENAARLAIQAALSISGFGLSVGVHTGLIITSSAPGLPDVTGKTSALAIRLLERAGPGAVVISAATQRLVVGYFDCISIDRPPLQNAFRVVRESGACHRLEAAAALTELTGRERESALLAELWQTARSGKRQLQLLYGDPGIGKSRLVCHLRQQLADQRVFFRELRCFAEFSHSPFHPLVGMFEGLLGFASDDSPGVKFDKVVRYIEMYHFDNRKEYVPLLAALLSLPTGLPYREQTLLPQQLRDRTMAFLVEHLYATIGGVTALLVVEDLHWVDPTTLELLSRFLADNRAASILVLFTARPEFRLPWPPEQVPVLTIPPLGDDEMQRLVAALGLDISHETVRHIVARADGVPLFAEEIARALPAAAADGPPAIPTTLHDLLAARLDALAEVKFTAQLAATIGREFQLDLLSEVAGFDHLPLLQSLCRLRETGLISGDDKSGFQFRHALFQDAAYQSQTRTDRQAMHRRIAVALQLRSADLAADGAEVLARHWTAAGELETAIEYWIKAGRQAGLRYAHSEAITLFRSGLELVRSLSDVQRQGRLEFELQVGIGSVCYAVEGYGSFDGVAAYARAVALGETQWNTPALFQALWGVWASTSSRTNYQESLELARRLIQMSELSNDPVESQQAHFAVGNIQFWRGEFAEAREHLELAMTLYRPEHHERHVTCFGENAYVTSGAYLSWALCAMGLAEQAEEVICRTVATARQAEHFFSLGYVMTFATVLQRMLRQPLETLKLAEETITLAVTHGFPLWEVGATLKQGWAQVMMGESEGVERMLHCVEAMRTVMSSITVIFLETLADGLRHLGRFEESLLIIRQAQEAVEQLGDRHVEAELHRLKGECLLGIGADNDVEAESCFRQALETARRQQARLFELRAAICLARLWQHRGQVEQAHHLLAEVYSGFTEGFDTPDLQNANFVLAQLAV